MVTIIKKGSDKKVVTEQINKALITKGVDTHKYCGTITLREDPLAIQKRMRDEWE